MPCPSYSLVTFPLTKKPPRAAPSAPQPPAPRTSQEPQAPLSPWEGRKAQPPPHPLKSSSWMRCPAPAPPGPCSGLRLRPPVAPCLLITGIKSPAKDSSSGGGVLLQQLLTRLTGNFLWEPGSSKQGEGTVALETGAISAAELQFPSKCPRQDLPGS